MILTSTSSFIPSSGVEREQRENKLYYSYWLEFAVLMVGAVIGAAALLPYSLKLLQASTTKKPQKLSSKTLSLLSFVQNVILAAITVGIGLFAAHKLGLGAPSIGAIVSGKPMPYSVTNVILLPLGLGLAIGALMTGIDLLFLPHWPKPILEAAKNTSLLENFYACFYGGFNEEYLTRLFGVSIIAWLLSSITHHNGSPVAWVMWVSIGAMAILFALGHLPTLKITAGSISGSMLARTLILNIPLAVVCGWLFWKYGIEAAIITHFTADIIYHVGGTIVLRYKLRASSSQLMSLN